MPAAASRYQLVDLLRLMDRLRDPVQGCPWDLQQDARSIINYSIEEVYELADAIEQGAAGSIRDELGDLLFQVVFLARLASEQGQFAFDDVVHGLCDKLLRRHPHVFPDGELDTAPGENQAGTAVDTRQVRENWEAIKRRERRERQQGGLFADVPAALPAMLRAAKLQKRAAGIGLDWPDAAGAMQSLREETAELAEAMDEAAIRGGGDHSDALSEELGDVLFSCVNVARKLGLNPEQALRDANRKFVQRAGRVQASLQDDGSDGDGRRVDAAEIDRLWQQAKAVVASGRDQ